MANSPAKAVVDNQLFQDVFHASPIGIVVENLDGQPLFVNPAFCAMLGFTEDEMRSKHCVDFSPPEDAQKDWTLFQQLRAGAIDHYQIEKRYFRRDGSLVWGSLNISVLKSHPSPLVIAMVEDITQTKTTEEARVRAERLFSKADERLRLALDAGSAGGWDFDLKTGKNTWFGKAHAQLGMTPDETPGSVAEFWACIHKDDRQPLEHALQTAQDKREEFVAEFRVAWRDGTTHWLRSRGRYQYGTNGEAERMLGISIDITEAKQGEQALREMNRALKEQSALLQSREELLNIFVKNVPAAVAMLDRDMRYLQVSERWLTDYLPGREQVLGQSHYEIFPDMPERWKEIHRRALQGETVRADEDRWEGRDGTHWARWEVRPWQNADGAIGGLLILAEEITRRKQMEETISGISRKMIEAQEEERSRIARELHDDVSQQLALLAVELDQWDQGNPGAGHKHFQEAKKRISSISQDVQSLSHQLHSSKLEYLGLVVAARSFCKEISDKHKAIVEFRSQGVSHSLSREVSLSLFRILQQALHNAVQHSGTRRVQVRLREHSNEVHLEIEDQGGGFDVSTALHGAGLGLTSMRERARLVGGEITIDSQPLRGTKIHVRVPLDSGADSQREAV